MTNFEKFSFKETIIKFNGIDSEINNCISYIYEMINDDMIRKNHLSLRNGIQLRDIHTNRNWVKLFGKNISRIYDAAYEWMQDSYETFGENTFAAGIQNMWINYSPPGAYNVMHNHPQANISGVFYLQCEEDSGAIVIPNPYSHGMDAPNSHRVYPQRNTGLVFYSGLQHYVDVNRSSTDRISVSFNILTTSRAHQIHK